MSETLATQGTDEWREARAGCITASNFKAVLTKGRKKGVTWGDTAMSYALQLACERLTGQPSPDVSSAAIEWGNENEPLAIAAYEEAQGVSVELAPFATHPLVELVGGSPDGYIGEDGIVEVKCPFVSVNQLRTVWNGSMPEEHTAQVQGNLWVTGRDWCDFVSFDPRLPDSCSLFISRVERDPEFIETLAERVEAFCGLVSEIVEGCRGQQ